MGRPRQGSGRRNAAKTSSALRESSSPAGSSAGSTDGRFAGATALVTRCCRPPGYVLPTITPSHAATISRHAYSSTSTLVPTARITMRVAVIAWPCPPSRNRSDR